METSTIIKPIQSAMKREPGVLFLGNTEYHQGRISYMDIPDIIIIWCVISIADFVVQEILVTLCAKNHEHYIDAIMGAMASQITSLTIVYSTVYSGAVQRKHQSSASLAFVREIHRWLVNSPHKEPVTRKMFPFDDVIKMILWQGHVFPVTDPLWGEPRSLDDSLHKMHTIKLMAIWDAMLMWRHCNTWLTISTHSLTLKTILFVLDIVQASNKII